MLLGVLLGVLVEVLVGVGVGDAQIAVDFAITSGASVSFIVMTLSLPVPEFLEIYRVELDDPAAVCISDHVHLVPVLFLYKVSPVSIG